jgi:hypothetical protein
MPYIKEDLRPELDTHIDALADAIVLASGNSEFGFAGLLNYACTRVAMRILDKRTLDVRYGHIALVTGVLKNVADEFYRRVAVPYEDKQMIINGDVAEYLKLDQQRVKGAAFVAGTLPSPTVDAGGR